jgi:predicted ATP-grasp superfamily ATP-dependent carboligase
LRPQEHLLIFGASARAAAFSALRAGLRPWCADMFGDEDLRLRCPSVRLASGDYPQRFVQVVEQAPPGPWMYTGALENHRKLIREIARKRPLWGESGKKLKTARSPQDLDQIYGLAGVPHPQVRGRGVDIPPWIADISAQREKWLVKPLDSAGGVGITFVRGIGDYFGFEPSYFQEYIEGEPCSALYVGDGQQAQLLGVTRQLTGETWLHSKRFHYCGSIGPLSLETSLRTHFERLGKVLVEGCGLRGLFGVDCVLHDGIPYPVEVNPRYTASVEVLEYATGLPALALHRRVFDPDAPQPDVPVWNGTDVVGKAILFARDNVTVSGDGPWSLALEHPASLRELPLFADIPQDGQQVRAGKPILTFFARAASMDACRERLQEIAADLDRWLFGH